MIKRLVKNKNIVYHIIYAYNFNVLWNIDKNVSRKKGTQSSHVHAYYQDQKATYDIRTGDKMEGEIPKDKEKLVSAWIILHKDELLADWELAQNGETPYNIDPLK